MDWRSAPARRIAAVGLISLLSACGASGGTVVTVGYDRIVVPPNADLSGRQSSCARLVIDAVGLAIRAIPVVAGSTEASFVCVVRTPSAGDSPRL